ncbi:MAG: ABC transporter permease [Hyphomicrobiales bacterium]
MRNSILHIIQREFKRIGKSRPLVVLFTVIPIVVFTLICMVYSQELIYELPVAVLDEDHTEMSRTVTRYVDASPTLNVVKSLESISQVESEIASGEFHAVFYIPKGTESEVKTGKQGHVGLYINSGNMLIGKLVYRNGLMAINTLSAGITIKQIEAAGKGESFAKMMANPIPISSRSLYNGSYNYLQYLTPGMLTVLLQMIVMFAGCIAINSEIKKETFGELLKISNSNILKIIVGKMVPYIVLSTVVIVLIVSVLFPIFSIKINGNLLNVYVLIELLVIASLLLGFGLSTLFKEIMAIDLAFVYNSPAFIFSGFTFPVMGMPWFDQVYAHLIPYTAFLDGFLKLYQMGLPFESAFKEMSILLIFILAGFIVTAVGLMFRIKSYNKENLMSNMQIS